MKNVYRNLLVDKLKNYILERPETDKLSKKQVKIMFEKFYSGKSPFKWNLRKKGY